ncbi:hypothetical protein ENUP19_0099G0019 [Entamoeba nuttalli]|uniref:Ankyrin repeat protein, putative n=2 Tax=Entamoeba nuttalli TaxID=412467 RepID=K2H0Q0_ENTNP|nr:ankyrin repeat protein, putative [Entamoeba nuttalli P19]EKE39827.1 ankyrin repeat protein, putative [Entamoeba nuttalli P19]|eukprot:XP_008857828.1 ankyrin repeat protein, putative [Entamoeba nuttalli P19]
MILRFADEALPDNHINLFHFIRDGKIEEIQKMIDTDPITCKAYVDDDQRTLLHCACELQSYSLVEKVLQICDNKNPVDEMLFTPLLVSVAGASMNNELDESYKIIQYLIEHGADITLSNKRKANVYHFACSRGRKDLVELFLSKWKEGASSRDKYGNTPLHRAVASGNIECTKLIAKKTHTIIAQNSMKKTPLHIACEEQNIPMIKAVIDLGGDADIVDEDGKFPFEFISDRTAFKEVCEYYKASKKH